MTRQGDDLAAQLFLARLGRGQDHAKKKGQLAEELGWTERAVKLAVRDLRIGGWLVLSGNDGYWLDGAPEAWLRRQNAQIVAMRQTYDAVLRNYQRQHDGEQTTLFGGARDAA